MVRRVLDIGQKMIFARPPDVSEKPAGPEFAVSTRGFSSTAQKLVDLVQSREISIGWTAMINCLCCCCRRGALAPLLPDLRSISKDIFDWRVMGTGFCTLFAHLGSLLGLMIGCKVKEVENIAWNTRKCST